MTRSPKDRPGGAVFDDLAGVEHRHVVAQMRGQPELMGDEQNPGAVLALQIAQEPDDVDLGGRVERRRRLVGDDEVGLADEGEREQHARAHAARQLKRILIDDALGRSQPHIGQRLEGHAAPVGFRHLETGEVFGEMLADR